MPESIKSLQFVRDYAKTLFEKRKDNHFEDSMKKSLFDKEETAFNVFVHAVTLLNWASKKTTNPNADNKLISINLDPDSTAPLHEQLLDLYDKAIEAYVEARTKFTEEDLKKTFKSPFGRDMTYEDWFGFIIHHTIGHIYQAFRLQAIYLRHKV
ncbi:MAG: DinB family protein [Candidatus Thorarchaeota archaeon]